MKTVPLRTQALLAIFSIALLGGHAEAQNRKVLPVDEATKDRSFKVFRDRLLVAARKKDRESILSMLDPNIQSSFGGHAGINDFKEIWKFDEPQSQFWNELTTVLKLGGAFKTTDGHREFVAPYVSSQWPDDSKLDVFEYVAVTGNNVKLRAAAGLAAPVLSSLSYDIVRLMNAQQPKNADHNDGYNWIKIMTADGKQGYVADKYIRSPIDYRAYFRKIKGSWRMTVFLAGD